MALGLTEGSAYTQYYGFRFDKGEGTHPEPSLQQFPELSFLSLQLSHRRSPGGLREAHKEREAQRERDRQRHREGEREKKTKEKNERFVSTTVKE